MTRRERGASYWPRAGAIRARPRRDFGRWRAPRHDPRWVPPPPARRRPQDRFAPPPQSLALRPRRGPRTVSPKVGTSSSKHHPAPFGATPERSRRSRPPNNTGNTPRRRRTVSAVVETQRARARGNMSSVPARRRSDLATKLGRPASRSAASAGRRKALQSSTASRCRFCDAAQTDEIGARRRNGASETEVRCGSRRRNRRGVGRRRSGGEINVMSSIAKLLRHHASRRNSK